jgi:serine/threonine protein kinase
MEQDELIGRRDTYRILSRHPFALGRSSTLYAATDSNGREVCVKIFRTTESSDEQRDQSEFLRELEAQTQLVHPNILPVLDFGRMEEIFSPFVVYPLCRAGSLRNLLQARPFLPASEAIPILSQVAAAIDAAHDKGFIHGDIKPENILFLDNVAQPRLSDFGISRHFPFSDRVSTAVPGPNAGTTTYLAPEQLADGKQSTKSDIYSFGIVAYEMLTGALPFDPNAPLYRQIEAKVLGTLIEASAANPKLSPIVTDALRAALHIDRGDRPGSAGEFCRMLRGEVVRPGPPRSGARRIRQGVWSSLDSKAKVAVITAAIAAAAGIITALINMLPNLFKR